MPDIIIARGKRGRGLRLIAVSEAGADYLGAAEQHVGWEYTFEAVNDMTNHSILYEYVSLKELDSALEKYNTSPIQEE